MVFDTSSGPSHYLIFLLPKVILLKVLHEMVPAGSTLLGMFQKGLAFVCCAEKWLLLCKINLNVPKNFLGMPLY